MKIAILGFGVEGESIYNYYHAQYPDATFVAYDNKSEPKNPLPEGVEFVGGVTDFKGIDADLAVKTPAIPPWKVEVTGEVTTMTREFLNQCPAPVIGVTGTKGKGTTSSLIKSILDAAGKKTWLVGNIGVGAFDILDQVQPDDIVVYEMSSFQLWTLDISPHTAVVLGIEPEHLDVHKDFNDYFQAKANIAKHQKSDDKVVYKEGNEWSEEIAQMSAGTAVPYLEKDGAYIFEDYFCYKDDKICPTSVMQIPGEHNIENACAAIAAVWDYVNESDVIAQGLHNFTGLPYRIQQIRTVEDVAFYNDSYSTAPAATLVALRAMKQPTVLIAGGFDRGADYTEFSRSLTQQPSLKKVVLIGQTADKIAKGLDSSFYSRAGTLEDAVVQARHYVDHDGAILFSPGCASFDMFKDFNERGRQFTEIVEAL